MADSPTESDVSPIDTAIAGLTMRSIGPAFMGGRIADIAVHPHRATTWYIAAGSGGVWKTTNAGTTWTAIFEDQKSFSIGCVAIDPTEPDVIWVGTGEAVSGRHVAWGDGVYRSRNGGASWDHMGLASTEHIGAMLIDPRDSKTLYVAAEGPLWSSGGERGVFKTTDAGETWSLVLEIDVDTGVTKIEFAPDNPDVIYAAAYQRRRHVASFNGGGPGSGIYKSANSGETWRKITEGLPEGEMGKIGLAVTPANPELVYATIEANKEDRGFYRSTDRGESWEKRNEYISGGTGPHYYQEIFASPIDEDRVYQADVFVQVTRDGGKTFSNLETGRTKHSDNHSVWIDPSNADHLLVGSDAGLYETFDEGVSFRHFSNMPLSQLYRVAVDNSLPFTNVLAGAQDLGTLYGPLRTTNVDGIRSQDWTVPLSADGYHVAFDPRNEDICYMEWQEGNVTRVNRRTNETIDIQPVGTPSDPPDRWNWDCPIVISPHDSSRIYVASQRVWQSNDQGDSWTPISEDLTTNRNRYTMATFGSVASIDSLYDHMAMSMFSTISHMCESPVSSGLLYAGTDDGLVHVTEDGGAAWRQTGSMPGLPVDSFINNVVASQDDADTVFVAADDHKHGDYTPFLFASNDRGRSWESIRGDLPDGLIIWSVQQDHVNADLLFVGTESGVYTTVNGGQNWHKLSKASPTISFRDLAVQRRDDDLVCASFGRGIFVLDDYSPLRTISNEALAKPASLFGVRDAWWYVPHLTAQAAGQPTLGSTAYRSPNPDFGATFTYHLADDIVGAKKHRQANEKTPREANEDIDVPDTAALFAEHVNVDPIVVAIVRDANGNPVRQIAAESKAGLHRTTWDLRYAAPQPVKLEKPAFQMPWDRDPQGPLVEPGEYSVELAEVSTSGMRSLTDPRTFQVRPIPDLAGHVSTETATFRIRTADLSRQVEGAKKQLETNQQRVLHLRATMLQTASGTSSIGPRLEALHTTFSEIRRDLVGDQILQEKLFEAATPSISQRLGRVAGFHWNTTQSPTQTQRLSLDLAESAFELVHEQLVGASAALNQLTADLDAAGGTWTQR